MHILLGRKLSVLLLPCLQEVRLYARASKGSYFLFSKTTFGSVYGMQSFALQRARLARTLLLRRALQDVVMPRSNTYTYLTYL